MPILYDGTKSGAEQWLGAQVPPDMPIECPNDQYIGDNPEVLDGLMELFERELARIDCPRKPKRELRLFRGSVRQSGISFGGANGTYHQFSLQCWYGDPYLLLSSMCGRCVVLDATQQSLREVISLCREIGNLCDDQWIDQEVLVNGAFSGTVVHKVSLGLRGDAPLCVVQSHSSMQFMLAEPSELEVIK